MTVRFHPEFPADVRKFAAGDAEVSSGLRDRFRREIDESSAAIKTAPGGAGHFHNLGSSIVPITKGNGDAPALVPRTWPIVRPLLR